MSWTRKIGHPNEVLEKGQRVSCQVLNVDQDRKRIALGLKQLKQDPWETDIPGRYGPGDVVTGKVTKLTNFGVFVELEPGLEGLLHISELADHKVDSPEEVVHVGDAIEVKVLRVDRGERKIGLSRKKAHESRDGGAEGEAPATAVRPCRAPPGSKAASAGAARCSASAASRTPTRHRQPSTMSKADRAGHGPWIRYARRAPESGATVRPGKWRRQIRSRTKDEPGSRPLGDPAVPAFDAGIRGSPGDCILSVGWAVPTLHDTGEGSRDR
jgi:predicted RNA-binding protein with RPS1 domain